MPLSPMDEFLAHQTPETFDQVFTSDRNFYDRYYFNLHPMSGDLFVVFGMGQYPNLGTTDAFVCIVHGGKQHVLRCSRELGSDRLNSTVGPFSVEVLEGLKRIRIFCDKNEHDISFDLTFDGTAPVFEELYDSVASGAEAKIVIEANRKENYREKLNEELAEIRDSELWQAGQQVRKLRPENN